MNLSRRDFAAALPALIAGLQLAAAQQGQAHEHLRSGAHVFADSPVRRTDILEYRRSCKARRLTLAPFPATNRLLHPTVSLIRLTTTRAKKCL
jgi:hypothetical protein